MSLAAEEETKNATENQAIKEIFAKVPGLSVEASGSLVNGPVTYLDGKKTDFDDVKGKFAFVSFAASWCYICTAEMPVFNSLYKLFKDDERFAMMVIFISETKGTIQTYRQNEGLLFPPLLDSSGQVAVRNTVKGTPTNYLLDPDGNIIAKQVGAFDWYSTTFLDALREAMASWDGMSDSDSS